jgi:hypothetical protein
MLEGARKAAENVIRYLNKENVLGLILRDWKIFK